MKHEILAPGIEIYQGDCFELLTVLGDKSSDVAITDPPYGIEESHKKNSSRVNLAPTRDYGENEWDSQRVEQRYFDQIRRVAKEQVIFGGNYYTDYLPPSSAWIVWDKLNSGDFADCELAWTSYKRAVRKFSYLWNGFQKQKPEERFHLTQKPLALMTWIVENYSAPGAVILDPFMGSGTTGVAAVRQGRQFIGVERKELYYEIAKRRISAALLQMNMFH